jgi:hypothetical protein
MERNIGLSLRENPHCENLAGHYTDWVCSGAYAPSQILRLRISRMIGTARRGGPGGADDVLPPRFTFDRYTPMLNHSPFAVATAVTLPKATPDFARDLYVANAARSPEGDIAIIMSSSDQNFQKYLTTREPVDG